MHGIFLNIGKTNEILNNWNTYMQLHAYMYSLDNYCISNSYAIIKD